MYRYKAHLKEGFSFSFSFFLYFLIFKKFRKVQLFNHANCGKIIRFSNRYRRTRLNEDAKNELLRDVKFRNRFPKTKLEIYFSSLREKTAKINKTEIPDPIITKGVVYFLYSKFHEQFFPGQTSNTAFERLLGHRYSINNKNTAIIRWIKEIGKDNLRTFVIEKVENPTEDNLIDCERKWQFRMNVVRKMGDFHNKLFLWSKCSRFCHATSHNSIKVKTAERPEIKQILQVNNSEALLHFPNVREFKTRRYLQRLLNIHNNIDKTWFPQVVGHLSIKTLRNFLNILTGKQVRILDTDLSNFVSSKQMILFRGENPENIKELHLQLREHLNLQSKNNLTYTFLEQLNMRIRKEKHDEKVKNAIGFHMVLEYHKQLVKIPLVTVFHKSIVSLPKFIQHFIKVPIIAFKQNLSLHQIFCNFKKVSTKTIPNEVFNQEPCKYCSKPEFKQFINKFGHIDTPSSDIFRFLNFAKRDEIINWFKLGARHVLPYNFNISRASDEILQQAEKWVNKLERGFPHFDFTHFREFLLQEIKIAIKRVKINNEPSEDPHYIKYIMKNVIHPYFNISLVDKAANNFYITCINYERLIIHFQITGVQLNYLNLEIFPNQINIEEDNTNRALYEEIKETPQEIISRHKKYLKKFDQKPNTKLPYLYLLKKVHKVGRRGVTSCKDTTTQRLGKILNVALNFIIEQCAFIAQKDFLETGFNWFWDITNNHDFSKKLIQLNNDREFIPNTIDIADIVGLYDRLPHDNVMQAVSEMITLVFEHVRHQFIKLNLNNGEAEWSPKPEKEYNILTITKNEIIENTTWLIANTYIVWLGKTFKAIYGIPQGGQCSGSLARLYLIAQERTFFFQNFKTNFHLIYAFKSTFRMMDDIISFNNP